MCPACHGVPALRSARNGPTISIASSTTKAAAVTPMETSAMASVTQPIWATPIVIMYLWAAGARSGSCRETCHHRNSKATRMIT